MSGLISAMAKDRKHPYKRAVRKLLRESSDRPELLEEFQAGLELELAREDAQGLADLAFGIIMLESETRPSRRSIRLLALGMAHSSVIGHKIILRIAGKREYARRLRLDIVEHLYRAASEEEFREERQFVVPAAKALLLAGRSGFEALRLIRRERVSREEIPGLCIELHCLRRMMALAASDKNAAISALSTIRRFEVHEDQQVRELAARLMNRFGFLLG